MAEENSKPTDIVIVEDQDSLSEIYKTRLELLGYRCVVALDGLQALVEIEKHRPSLVLLDLMLPKLSGEQILRLMRETDWGKNIKVYIISNINEVDAPPGLRSLGIVGYTVKANMSNDQVDKIVDSILRPVGQLGTTSIEGNSTNIVI